MPNSTMIGTGFTPEGLTDSYITTELMSEISWRTEPVKNMTDWIDKYLTRRYGKSNGQTLQGYLKLSEKVFNSKIDHFNQKVLLVNLPSLNMTDFTWYDFEDVGISWDFFMNAMDDLKDESGFQ